MSGAPPRFHVDVEPFPLEGTAPPARELLPGALATPYQAPAWIDAYARTVAPDRGERIVVARVLAGDEVVLALPLALRRVGPATIGAIVGGRHANLRLPAFCVVPALDDAASVAEAMTAAGRAVGADLLAFRGSPASWDGAPTPLAHLPHRASALALPVRAPLEAPQVLASALMSGPSRKKLRRKAEKLAAALGPLRHVVGGVDAEIGPLLDAYFRQKAARFEELGIPDPFDRAADVAFLRGVANPALGAVEVHALCAGERVLAVLAGACDGQRFSGMVSSIEADAEIRRSSPGDLLMVGLLERLAARGVVSFDLGIGEASYKADYCPAREALIDVALPVTGLGRMLAPLIRAGWSGSDAIRRRPALRAAAQRVRGWRPRKAGEGR